MLSALCVVALSSLPLAPADEKAVPRELARLQGTWLFQTLEINGQQVPENALKGATITIKGDQFETRSFGVVYSGQLKIDPTKSPKTLDLIFTGGPEKGKTTLAIYELEGDSFKICLTLMGQERPKEFSAKVGSGRALEVLKREKK
jgi:uncharacterized protein (TIGR03067 family)